MKGYYMGLDKNPSPSSLAGPEAYANIGVGNIDFGTWSSFDRYDNGVIKIGDNWVGYSFGISTGKYFFGGNAGLSNTKVYY